MPRRRHLTGDIDIHEMEYAADGTLWLVNTRFSCLCTLNPDSSFVPRLRPPFVSGLAPEDRCHLNGVGLVDGRPKYAILHGSADTPQGWRADKSHGGVLLDVDTGKAILEGLAMPHSPRWHQGRLWLQESGDGSIGWVDFQRREYIKVCDAPGFTRGFHFAGPPAFIGLSQVRESAVFSGIPLGERLKEGERICGVYVIHMRTGQPVAYLHFTSGVQEIFAIRVLPRCSLPS